MNKYDSYKDSGIEWIGQIPKHWKVTKLRYLAKINESTPTFPIDKNSEEKVVFLPMENVSEEGYINQNIRRSIKDLKSGYTYFEKNDVLVAKITPCFENGKGALLYNLKTSFGYGSTEFHTLRANQKILPRFLWYIVKSEEFMSLGEMFMSGSAGQKRVSSEFVKNFKIGLPSLNEQETIADYLSRKTSKLDDLISKKERLIKLLEEEKTAVINQSVTKGFDLSVQMKDSGVEWLDEIPEHWKVRKIISVSESITGFAFKSAEYSIEEGVKLVRGDNVTEGRLRWGDKTRKWNKLTPELDKFYLKPNDIVIGMDGSKVGKNFTLINEKDLPLLLVQRVARVRAHNELYAKYILYSISSYNFKFYINSSKTDPAIPHITLKNIRDFKLVIPSTTAELEELVTSIEFKIDELNRTITTVKREVLLLKEYKKALISEVVTGKVDVRDEILVN